MYRFSCAPQVLFTMVPRNSDAPTTLAYRELDQPEIYFDKKKCSKLRTPQEEEVALLWPKLKIFTDWWGFLNKKEPLLNQVAGTQYRSWNIVSFVLSWHLLAVVGHGIVPVGFFALAFPLARQCFVVGAMRELAPLREGPHEVLQCTRGWYSNRVLQQ